MKKRSIPYKVRQCSKCPGDARYYCVSCTCGLCPRCEESHVHVKDLETLYPEVLTYSEKLKCILKKEFCVKHPSNVYKIYCQLCQVPLCDSFFGHESHRFPISLLGKRRHNFQSIQEAYRTKRQQHSGTIHAIRSGALVYRPLLLTGIKADFKTCSTEFSLSQSKLLTRAQKLKDLIGYLQTDFMCNVFCDFDFKHRCLKQKI